VVVGGHKRKFRGTSKTKRDAEEGRSPLEKKNVVPQEKKEATKKRRAVLGGEPLAAGKCTSERCEGR